MKKKTGMVRFLSDTAGGAVLVVSADRMASGILTHVLESEKHRTVAVPTGREGIARVSRGGFDVLVLDLGLPEGGGLAVLREVLDKHPGLPVVVLSDPSGIRAIVESTKLGAFDVLEKPLDTRRILIVVKNAVEKARWEQEKSAWLERAREQAMFYGKTPAIARILENVRKAAQSDSKVLISGENGTGKELLARSIHLSSARASKPFVAINCAAIPDTLIESELFGYVRGAFTGAGASKIGRFQAADKGTLFLDEIADMSLLTQAKVLRILEDGVVERVGSTRPERVDVRVIAATNKDLAREMEQGRFRDDLYFRLAVVTIAVPPLRERKEDIPLLVDLFLKQFCLEHGRMPKTIGPDALKILIDHMWHGNVRELKNTVEKLVVLVDQDRIGRKDVFSVLDHRLGEGAGLNRIRPLKEVRAEFESRVIREALNAASRNVTKAAAGLGIPRTYLYKKMKQLNVRP